MKRTRTKRKQRGRGVDIQKLLSKTGIEYHVPGYQYLGTGTKLKKRLARGDPGKTDWIVSPNNTTSIIPEPRTYRTNGELMLR